MVISYGREVFLHFFVKPCEVIVHAVIGTQNYFILGKGKSNINEGKTFLIFLVYQFDDMLQLYLDSAHTYHSDYTQSWHSSFRTQEIS